MKLKSDVLNHAAGMIVLANMHATLGHEMFIKLMDLAVTGTVEEISAFLTSKEVQEHITSSIQQQMGELELTDFLDQQTIN
jgi:hypothetical protein